MGETKHIRHFGLDQLENELQTPIENDKQAWRILEKLAECFIDSSRSIDNIKIEVYGNGVPGGLKAQVITLLDKIESIQDNQSRMEEKLDATILRTSNKDERQIMVETAKQERKDSFDGLVDWFKDKVLPSVVSYVIMTGMLIFAFAVVWASGLVKVSAP